MTKPTQKSDEKGVFVSGRCPAHGDWQVKFPVGLGDEALEAVECPECSKMPSMRALSLEMVTLTGRCDKHGGAWTREVPKFAEGHMAGRCPRCDEEMKNRQDAEERQKARGNASRKKQAKIDELFDRAAIPRRFLNRSFDNYRTEGDAQALVLARAKRYAYKFDQAMARGASMVFYGKPGTGKNHLAAAIANHVIPNFGASVMFITVYELLQRIRASYKDSGPSESDIIKECAEVDLLILDEVGVQLGSRHEEVILTDLINRRYANVRPIILLTNLDREQIEVQLGARVVDRMEEGGGGSLAFEWDSYRSKVLKDDDLKGPDYDMPDWMADS